MSDVTQSSVASTIERVLIGGDLSQLNPEQSLQYYKAVCESVGLNPLTKPFEYLTLNNKRVLYATRSCTEQLRQIHKISLKVASREKVGDVYVVTANAKTPEGREDESTGAVSVVNLKGDALANAYMKAETKAKRRVTLSICGLSLLDESEVDGLKGASLQNHETGDLSDLSTAKLPTPLPNDKNTTTGQPRALPPIPTDGQRRLCWARAKGELKLSDQETREFFQKVTGKESSKTWIRDDIQKILNQLDEIKGNNPQNQNGFDQDEAMRLHDDAAELFNGDRP